MSEPLCAGDLCVADAPTGAPAPTNPLADPRFLLPLILEYVDGHWWRLFGKFSYQTDVLRERVVFVPSGFMTDFASVPRFLWVVMPPTGKYGKAAVIHDFLYRTPGLATRKQADQVFLEAMTALGVSRVVRQTMYRGVRLFGGLQSYRGGL